MASEWIRSRHASYLERVKREAQELEWRRSAEANCPALFEELQKQIADDVEDYNRLFPEECQASFRLLPGGFRVDMGSEAVFVKRPLGNTVIAVDHIASALPDDHIASGKSVSSHFEVAPDARGNMGYKDESGIFLDAVQVSEQILDPVLCK